MLVSSLVICPKCNGKKTWPCVARMLTEKGWEDCPVVNMPCHTCNETGLIDPVEHERKEQERKAEHERFWCSCKKSSGSSYYQFGRSHGWSCNDCGKVTQVG